MHSRVSINLFVGALGCVFGFLQFQWAAFFILVYLMMCWYENVRQKHDQLHALSLILNSVLIFSVSIYSFGQYIHALPHGFIRVLVFTLVSLLSLSSEINSSRRPVWSKFAASLFLSAPLLVLWYIPISRIVSFLGFGYDNYAHLMMIRKILIDRKGFSGSGDSAGVVSELGGTANGAHTFIAVLMEASGVNGSDISTSLRFYSFVVIACPILFVLF